MVVSNVSYKLHNKTEKLEAYTKYTGKFTPSNITEPVKRCHQLIKNFIINKYSNNINTLVDIGTGRGHDVKAWNNANIKTIIGLEPSESSYLSALSKLKSNNIIYLRAIGNKLWCNGDAALDDKAKEELPKIKDADRIHMFWTIHYCIDTKQDFRNLYNNINNTLTSNNKLIILLMNGELIHKLLNKYNGIIKVVFQGEIIFYIKAYYDYASKSLSPYGNKIGVFLLGTYGLNTEIIENIVSIKFLCNYFNKHSYNTELSQNFIKFSKINNITCMHNLINHQKIISLFYNILIFNKK